MNKRHFRFLLSLRYLRPDRGEGRTLHHRIPGETSTAFTPINAGRCHGREGGVRRVVPTVDPAAVLTALDAVITSKGFARSPRMQRFLRHIVEETLAGRGDQLKEYAIAVDVFERDTSYDPQTNSLVRVEASRLRAKLERYNDHVQTGGVAISLPPGSYAPVFTRHQSVVSGASASGSRPRFANTAILAAIAVVFLFAALIVAGHWTMLWDGVESQTRNDAGPPTVKGMPTIAVMPLRNISDDADDDFLADGLTDALITNLARQRSVRVIAHASSRSVRIGVQSRDSIARALGVSHIVEGTVLREGGIVRISAKLIEAEKGRYVWAESYDRPLVELLSLQADLARQIVTSLSAALSDGTSGKVPSPAADEKAHEAYLMGRYFRNMATESGFRKGIAYFKDAITRAPDFAEAYSGMAACYCVLGGHGFELVDPRDGMPAAKQAIAEAMRLNAGLAEAHAFAGIIKLKYDWDWVGAEQAFRKSIDLNPSYAQAHLFYSYYLEAMGDQQGSIREAEEARALDPLSLPLNANLIWQYLRGGRMKAALERLDWTRELDPDFWAVHWGYGHYYRQTGDLDRSIASFAAAVKGGGGHALPIADLGYTYAQTGRVEEALAMLASLKAMAETGYVSPYTLAVIHIGLGKVDEAFAALEEAYRIRSRSLAWLLVAREFDPVRSDPRFRNLMARIGLPG